ncbi:MAG: rhodanese-like domain-containing protein [Deltaproteobacteria bacterium]|nr:rhodanese-like domain-containing protein [Deltaproteobacteria bacterium]
MYALVKEANFQVSKDIFPTEAWELMSTSRKGEDVVIIDVSTLLEYKALHLEGAINVNLISRFFKSRLDVMDKQKTYVVYCKLGGRSKIAQKLMKQLGFQTVYNIVSGTILWKEEGLPFASGTDGVNKFSFCPFLISIIAFKKIKKFCITYYRASVKRKTSPLPPGRSVKYRHRSKGGDIYVRYRILQFLFLVDISSYDDSHVLFYVVFHDERTKGLDDVRVWFLRQRQTSCQPFRFCNGYNR